MSTPKQKRQRNAINELLAIRGGLAVMHFLGTLMLERQENPEHFTIMDAYQNYSRAMNSLNRLRRTADQNPDSLNVARDDYILARGALIKALTDDCARPVE